MGWKVGVEFKQSPVHGMGIFARQGIKRGTRIWEVDASMRFDDAEALKRLSPERIAYALHGGYLHRPADRLVWYEDGMQYMNHAPGARANVGLTYWPELGLDHTIALRDIEAGEELFEDYGFWVDAGIGEFHWLAPLYREHCPGHIEFLQSLAPAMAA